MKRLFIGLSVFAGVLLISFTSTRVANAWEKQHVLQITAFNFLRGGEDAGKTCIKDNLFFFKKSDKNVKTSVCKNSLVEVSAVSNLGTITFQANYLFPYQPINEKGEFGEVNIKLPATDYAKNPPYELGKTQIMLRYGFENQFGFTYVMAEEVTDLDLQLVDQFNQIDSRQAELTAQVLTAEKEGKVIDDSVLKEMVDNKIKMQKIAEEIVKKRSQLAR